MDTRTGGRDVQRVLIYSTAINPTIYLTPRMFTSLVATLNFFTALAGVRAASGVTTFNDVRYSPSSRARRLTPRCVLSTIRKAASRVLVNVLVPFRDKALD